MDERKRRIAENEARFRSINDRLNADLRRHEVDEGRIPFVCECGRSACTLPVELTAVEYEVVRGDPRAFVVTPGHEIVDTEDVVRREERFSVVRKHEEAAPIVEDDRR